MDDAEKKIGEIGATRIGALVAVVVLYRRLMGESETLATLSASAASAGMFLRTIVYDNTPGATDNGTRATLAGCDVVYLADGRNVGLARAYNEGFRRAETMGATFVLLLDQDSCLPEDFVVKVLASIERHSDVHLHVPMVRVCGRCVSPVRLRLGRDIGFTRLQVGRNHCSSFFCINSGSVISVKRWRMMGGYDESYFLYCTDNWFSDLYGRAVSEFAIMDVTIDHDMARETCRDIETQLRIYAETVAGMRRLYRRRPCIFAVVTLAGIGGAIKKACKYRDLRFLTAFARPGRFWDAKRILQNS